MCKDNITLNKKNLIILRCGHIHHLPCIKSWLNIINYNIWSDDDKKYPNEVECPLCRVKSNFIKINKNKSKKKFMKNTPKTTDSTSYDGLYENMYSDNTPNNTGNEYNISSDNTGNEYNILDSWGPDPQENLS